MCVALRPGPPGVGRPRARGAPAWRAPNYKGDNVFNIIMLNINKHVVIWMNVNIPEMIHCKYCNSNQITRNTLRSTPPAAWSRAWLKVHYCMYVCIYIYMYWERERCYFIYIYIYICIYTHTYIYIYRAFLTAGKAPGRLAAGTLQSSLLLFSYHYTMYVYIYIYIHI